MRQEHKLWRQKTIALLTACTLGMGLLTSGCGQKFREIRPTLHEVGAEPVINPGDEVLPDLPPSLSDLPELPGTAQGDGFTGLSGTPGVHTGQLSETGNGYEGTKGTGKYNYGEALQKAVLFYELQRSGDLPEETRCNWRGDSGLTDGADHGLDLTGGLYDAGDNVKFNLPMAYTSSVLAWSVYEYQAAYEESGQYEYILDTIRWIDDYLIKCHPEDHVYYYQVGDGNADHSWWGPCETMQMKRPSYCVTDDQPGSTVVAEAAAALAAGAVIYGNRDSDYAKTCLKHAKSLYEFAESTKSDSGYTAANGFYNSWSGYTDELCWAGVWLYLASGEKSYLTKAEGYWDSEANHKWALCWDDKNAGATLLLARLTDKACYRDWMEKHLDWWTTGIDGERVTYSPKGLAWLDSWGSLRYATTTAFLAGVYSSWKNCPKTKAETYSSFALKQVNYALGDGGRSFVVGYGENPPTHPHHRTSQGSYCDNMNEPATFRHTLYGALVGGPDANDGYSDVVTDYNRNEVACDYNAGFTGALAYLYSLYHGQTLVDFGAVEPVTEDEVYVEGSVNVSGADFIEIRAFVKNESGWPARVLDDLELRYFIDITEILNEGGSAENVLVSTNYNEGVKECGVYSWDEEKNLYYVSVDFTGTKIYPGGQNTYKKEVQVRIRNSKNNGAWDNSNDPSYAALAGNNGSRNVRLTTCALYSGGQLIYGTEPPCGENPGVSIVTTKNPQAGSEGSGQSGADPGGSGQSKTPELTVAKNQNVSVSWDNAGQSNGNTIALGLTITNTSDGAIELGDLSVLFFFTRDGKEFLAECDYSCAVSGNDYRSLAGVTGSLSPMKKETKTADTVCTITPGERMLLAEGGTWTFQVRLHTADWSNADITNDYSMDSVEQIVIQYGDKGIFGKEP